MSHKGKIVIAEDDEELNDMLVEVFMDEDFYVDAAFNGFEAYELINKNSYQVVLADMFMPKMNGFQLFKKCKAEYPQMKYVLMSGGGRQLEVDETNLEIFYKKEKLSVDGFIKKPCDLLELVSSIANLIN